MNWLMALHLIVLAMGTGMSFSNYMNYRLAAAADEAGQAALAKLRLALGRAGDVVIALIWASGLGLAWRMTGGEAGLAGGLPPSFHAKMLLVLILTISHAASRWAGLRAMRQGRTELIPVARAATLAAFASAVGSIILAVASFR